MSAEGNPTALSHDGLGRTVSMTKPPGNAYTLDANHNLLAVDGPLDWHLGYEYDANDNPVRKIDPNGGEIRITYNVSDKPVTVHNPLGFAVLNLSYGLMYELNSREDAEGRLWSYQYDELLRVTGAYGPPAVVFSFKRWAKSSTPLTPTARSNTWNTMTCTARSR